MIFSRPIIQWKKTQNTEKKKLNCQNQAKTPETLQVTENPKESSVNIYNVVMI
jgi:hypothetical protein